MRNEKQWILWPDSNNYVPKSKHTYNGATSANCNMKPGTHVPNDQFVHKKQPLNKLRPPLYKTKNVFSEGIHY